MVPQQERPNNCSRDAVFVSLAEKKKENVSCEATCRVSSRKICRSGTLFCGLLESLDLTLSRKHLSRGAVFLTVCQVREFMCFMSKKVKKFKF